MQLREHMIINKIFGRRSARMKVGPGGQESQSRGCAGAQVAYGDGDLAGTLRRDESGFRNDGAKWVIQFVTDLRRDVARGAIVECGDGAKLRFISLRCVWLDQGLGRSDVDASKAGCGGDVVACALGDPGA